MIENQTTDRMTERPSAPATTGSRNVRRSNKSKGASLYSGLIHRIQSKADPTTESLSIGIVGCHSNAGVSTICANFAQSCSFDLEQEILLISANPNDAGLSKTLDVKPKQGLNDLVMGNIDFESAIVQSPKADICLISNGLGARESFSHYIVSRFPAIVAEAKERYRVVIVDLEPLDKVSESAALAKQLDAVILVIDGTRTKKDSAKKAQRALVRNGANLVGSILNR